MSTPFRLKHGVKSKELDDPQYGFCFPTQLAACPAATGFRIR